MFGVRAFVNRQRSTLLLALGVLALDLIAPVGLPLYMLYAPLACREAFLRPYRTRPILPVGLALLALGLLIPPQAGIPWQEWAGRGVAALTLLMAVRAGSAAGRSRDRHRRTEERLSEIEGIYAAAPVGLGLVDTDLRYLRVNERLAALHGRPAAEHLGRSIREVLPRPLSIKLEEIHRRVLETGQAMRAVELSSDDATHPGVRREWLASYEPVRDTGNRVVGVSAVVHDVSRFAQAERLWRARAARLRALYRLSELEAGSAGVDEICVAALDGLIEGLEADRAGVLLRAPEGGLVFRASRGFSGGLQDRLARLFTRREQDEGDVSTLVVHDIRRLPDGPLHHALRQEGVGALILMPLDHGRGVPGSLVVAWDRPRRFSDELLDAERAIARHVATADERRRREEALMLSEERFGWLSDSGILAIATFDMEGRILEANDAFLDMVRYSRADLAAGGVRWDRLTPPEWMDRTHDAVREMSSTGRVVPTRRSTSAATARACGACSAEPGSGTAARASPSSSTSPAAGRPSGGSRSSRPPSRIGSRSAPGKPSSGPSGREPWRWSWPRRRTANDGGSPRCCTTSCSSTSWPRVCRSVTCRRVSAGGRATRS
ncbi:MAG: PAS domain-containing protein [Candidatus Polarisedimenticolia bacterium]